MNAPITVTDNAVSVLGDSTATTAPPAVGTTPHGGTPPAASGPSTSGDDAILGGTQITAPVTAPVTALGNAVAVLGHSTTTTGPAAGSTSGGPGATTTGTPGTPGTPGGHGAASTPVSNAASAQSGPRLAQTGGASPMPLILSALLLLMIGSGILTRRALTR